MTTLALAALQAATGTRHHHRLDLCDSYQRLNQDELLAYYRTRSGVHYFAVADPEETRADKIEAILENRFEFNGEVHALDNPIDWLNNPSTDIEWHILLHKFYYAVGLGMAYRENQDERYQKKWIALTDSWIDQTPPGFIASDVTGRRIQNWIYAYYHLVENKRSLPLPADFHFRFLASLQEQTDYLCDHLAPARNHRTLELYAIFLAGVVFPEMLDAQAWRQFALSEIVKNMQTDLLPDGVQCELSTDYHHIVLKNYLCVRRLAKLNAIAVPSRMDEYLNKALDFSLHAHKPDGVVPSLSDGDARSYRDLLLQGYELYGREDLLYAATQGIEGHPPPHRSTGFKDSGYYFLRSGWGEGEDRFEDERYLVFDCGPLGAGNHGHLDLLNIEIAAYGRSLVVDPGRYTYKENDEPNWRVKFRGTAYHNTVMVDGQDQTLYSPGTKRYKIQGPAPRYKLRRFITTPHFDYLHGIASSHEYDAVHERRIFFLLGEYWLISDILNAEQTHRYDLLYHFSEHAQGNVVVSRNTGTRQITTPNLIMAMPCSTDSTIHIEDGFVSYRYGHKIPAPIIRIKKRARCTAFHTALYPYRDDAPKLTTETIPVTRIDGSPNGHGAYAIRIGVETADARYSDVCFFAPDGKSDRCSFGAYRYDGSYLVLRKNADGQITHLLMSDGARLEEDNHPVGSPEVTI